MFCPFTDDLHLTVHKNVAESINSVGTSSKLSARQAITNASVLLSSVDIPKRKILTSEEYDVNNANFTPQKSESNDSLQWVHNMSDLQFAGLVGLCIVGPFLMSLGLTKVLRARESKRHSKMAAAVATQFLRHAGTYDKKFAVKFFPKLPGNGPYDVNKPIQAQYPPFQDPTRMGDGINWNNWRNPNIQEVTAALNRVNRISEKELAYFHHMYTKFPHVPSNQVTIERTLKWVITGEVTLDEARYQVVPKAAADELSLEDKKILNAENWQTMRVSPEVAKDLNEKSRINFEKMRQENEAHVLEEIKHNQKDQQ